MQKFPKKVVFAAGGTGGHLFPAQALAEQLLKQKPDIELLFAGAKLSENPYFDKEKFAHQNILSTTPFRGGFIQSFKSIAVLFKGVRQSLHLFKQQKPDIVIGFGSFHAFPVLFAAVLKRIPIVMFESNAIPGKVVRLFSKKAVFTGIFFSQAKKHLKGKTVEVEIPKKVVHAPTQISSFEARNVLGLDPHQFTILVFGGSQGAKAINGVMKEVLPLLQKGGISLQLIHFTGNVETTMQLKALCEQLGVRYYIKEFEPQMHIAWSAADLVICRSGAMTLSELLSHEIPGILIPYPFAADHHQLKNALFLENEVKGGLHFKESSLSATAIAEVLFSLAVPESPQRIQMKEGIRNFKAQQKKADLGSLILQIF